MKDFQWTPTGESAINIFGIVRVEPRASANTQQTQVANCEYADESVTLKREHSMRFVFQDTEKWNSAGATYLYEGQTGTATCKNQLHNTGASDETHTWSVCKITEISTSMAAGEGPQEINVDVEIYPTTGTASPLTKT